MTWASSLSKPARCLSKAWHVLAPQQDVLPFLHLDLEGDLDAPGGIDRLQVGLLAVEGPDHLAVEVAALQGGKSAHDHQGEYGNGGQKQKLPADAGIFHGIPPNRCQDRMIRPERRTIIRPGGSGKYRKTRY